MTALSTDPPAKYRSVINLCQREGAPVNEICDTCRGKVFNGEHVIKGTLHTHFCYIYNNNNNSCLLATLLCHVCLHRVTSHGASPYFTSIFLSHAC